MTNNEHKLRIVYPEFSSDLAKKIFDIEKEKNVFISASTPPSIFFELTGAIRLVESVNSSKIEGNKTTIAQAIDYKLGDVDQSESWKMILGVFDAMKFIDQNITPETIISKLHLREIHKIVTKDLHPSIEGDITPGEFRKVDVIINKSSHVPPSAFHFENYLDELINFINQPKDPRSDLLKIALAHHEFTWIHPFNNGNGRMARLLTYLMLTNNGYSINDTGIIGISSFFVSNKDTYYKLLNHADTNKDENIIDWCTYFLTIIEKQILKAKLLLNYNYVSEKILKPSILNLSDAGKISKDEKICLLRIIEHRYPVKLSDIQKDLVGDIKNKITQRLSNKKLIKPQYEKSRKFILDLQNGMLLWQVVNKLSELGIIDKKLD